MRQHQRGYGATQGATAKDTGETDRVDVEDTAIMKGRGPWREWCGEVVFWKQRGGGKFSKVGDSGIQNCKTRCNGVRDSAIALLSPELGRNLVPSLLVSPITYLLQAGRPGSATS